MISTNPRHSLQTSNPLKDRVLERMAASKAHKETTAANKQARSADIQINGAFSAPICNWHVSVFEVIHAYRTQGPKTRQTLHQILNEVRHSLTTLTAPLACCARSATLQCVAVPCSR